MKYIFRWNLLHFYQLGLPSPDVYLGCGLSSAIRSIWLLWVCSISPEGQMGRNKKRPPVYQAQDKRRPGASPRVDAAHPRVDAASPGVDTARPGVDAALPPPSPATHEPPPPTHPRPCLRHPPPGLGESITPRAGSAPNLQVGSQPHCPHVGAVRLNSATLSWQLTLNGPLPSGRRRWEAGSQAPEPQPGVPPSVAGSPAWRERIGAQSGGLSPELEPTWARCLLHTAPPGQDQGGTETCPHCL